MITDELRAWAKEHLSRSSILAIANRIDAEYEKAIHELNGFAEVSVLLPKDADGEVWNVGDFAVGEVNPNNPQEVERMLWYGLDSGWQIETDHIIFPCPEKAHHYHAPTVEDVLREMLYKAHIYDEREMELLPDLIAEYAAQLQLRGDAE